MTKPHPTLPHHVTLPLPAGAPPHQGARRQASHLLGAVLLLLSGCGSKVAQEGPASSQTHWLGACDTEAQCGDKLDCVCGVCTTACSTSSACSDLAGAVCASAGSACAGQEPAALCLKACENDADCGSNKQCTLGACELRPSTAPTATAPTSAAPTSAGSAPDAGTPKLSAGESCTADAECESGACKTATCFAEDAVCVDGVTCLTDIQEFCSCEGETITGSSGSYGCVAEPYAFAAPCGSGSQPDGAHCSVNEDCASGRCEGLGCGPFEGTCINTQTPCPSDLQVRCGCDGVDLAGGSSCAGGRYASEEPCANSGALPNGSACDVPEDCASGICEGPGCGPGEGVCQAPPEACTDDLAEFCTCEGETVSGVSSSCFNIRYAHRGACTPPN